MTALARFDVDVVLVVIYCVDDPFCKAGFEDDDHDDDGGG